MKDIYEKYTNDTDTIQSFTDFSGKPVTVKVGESLDILVGRSEEHIFPEEKKNLDPIVEEREEATIYKDPGV